MSYWREGRWWLALLAAPMVWAGLLWFLPNQTGELLWRQPWLFVQLALIYPLLEEIVFRGGLQGWLLQRFASQRWAGLSLANVLTTLVFCLMHGMLRQWETALLVLLPSLLFGYFRERYQGLSAPITLHCFYNAGFFYLFGAV